MKEDKYVVIIAGMVCLTLIEMFALSKGINGTLMGAVFVIIGSGMGIMIPTPKRLK